MPWIAEGKAAMRFIYPQKILFKKNGDDTQIALLFYCKISGESSLIPVTGDIFYQLCRDKGTEFGILDGVLSLWVREDLSVMYPILNKDEEVLMATFCPSDF